MINFILSVSTAHFRMRENEGFHENSMNMQWILRKKQGNKGK